MYVCMHSKNKIERSHVMFKEKQEKAKEKYHNKIGK